jgi:hypothetical protein
LQKELRRVDGDIIALRHYLHGLSLTLGEEHFSAELLRLIHPKRTNTRDFKVTTATAQQRGRRYQKLSPYVHIFDASPEKAFHFTNPVKRGNAMCPTKRVKHNNGTGGESPMKQKAPKFGFAGGLSMTRDLVKQAEAKLVALHSNRSQLGRRIRALHYLLKTIDTECVHLKTIDTECVHSRRTELYLRPEAVKSKTNHHERSKFETDSETAAISPIATKETRAAGPALTETSTKLRRACRIALMESDRPQYCEQILQRIHRRESVCIQGFRDPVIAVAQELRAMLADGEVIQQTNKQLWQLNRGWCGISEQEA